MKRVFLVVEDLAQCAVGGATAAPAEDRVCGEEFSNAVGDEAFADCELGVGGYADAYGLRVGDGGVEVVVSQA